MSGQENTREAWVAIPTEDELRSSLPPGTRAGNYDFGYLPAMGRLQATHKAIGPMFGPVPGGHVRSGQAEPTREGDGGCGGRGGPGLPVLNGLSRRVSAC